MLKYAWPTIQSKRNGAGLSLLNLVRDAGIERALDFAAMDELVLAMADFHRSSLCVPRESTVCTMGVH